MMRLDREQERQQQSFGEGLIDTGSLKNTRREQKAPLGGRCFRHDPVRFAVKSARLSRREKGILIPDGVAPFSFCADIEMCDVNRRKLPYAFKHHESARQLSIRQWRDFSNDVGLLVPIA